MENVKLESGVENLTKMTDNVRPLVESEKFLQSVLNGIQDIINIVDRDYNIVYTNSATEERTGKLREKVIGNPCHKEMYKFNEPCYFCTTSYTFETGKVGHTQYMTKGDDKTDEFIELSTFPIFDEGDKVEYVIEIAKDITERKKLESQLIQSSKLAAIGELAGGIAHQINNPLVGILNFAQLLLRRMKPTDPNRQLAETVEKAGMQCLEIIKSLLKFSRDAKFDLDGLDVNDAIEHTLTFIERQLSFKGIKVIRKLSSNLPNTKGNQNQLAQVFLNIMHNSADAMPNGGTLEIESKWDASDRKVVVKFTDSGTGIPKETIDKVFEPFFTTKDAGTGLGLSVAHGIIKNHGGLISVNSRESEGTTFVIELPVQPAAS